MPSGAAADDYSIRISSPYLLGLYLAVNAIPDAFLLLDGPSCFPLKSPTIQGNHDWGSTLTDVSGYHRAITTHAHPSDVVFSRREALLERIRSITSDRRCGAVFVSARPMATLTGEDYEAIIRDARPVPPKRAFHVAPMSLRANWLAGYEELLLAMARQMDLTPAPQPDTVAIIGYLFDRHEGDHLGNLRELRRYLAALGLDLQTVWLSGRPLEDLAAVQRASTIVSLPYARKPARLLAERLAVPLVETCLPFGLRDTQRFLRDVAARFGREERAERLIEEELAEVVPRLEWVVPFIFQNADVGFIGDPNHLPGLHDILRVLGANLGFALLTGDAKQLPPPGAAAFEPTLVRFDPTQKELLTLLPQQRAERGLDLLVTSNVGVKLGSVPIVEFGFPSYFTHALAPRPFLGFAGCLAFIDTMANTIRHAELH